MSHRSWLLIAALGLILSFGSGQAQEQTEGPEGQAEQQQDPAPPNLPTPFPVEIIQDEGEVEARERREQERRRDEQADLLAQQGMNAATQSIDAATKDMRDYARYSTIAVWVGTVLLIVTLVLTWMANRAAQAAIRVTREMGRAQARAYVGPDWAVAQDRASYSLVAMSFRNTGVTPSKWVRVAAGFAVEKSGVRPAIDLTKASKPDEWPAIAGGGENSMPVLVGPEIAGAICRVKEANGNLALFVFGYVEYCTMFDEVYRTEFVFHANSVSSEFADPPARMGKSDIKVASYRLMDKRNRFKGED